MVIPPMSAEIEVAFEQFPDEVATVLRQLRELLYLEAEAQGKKITENVKWGQPSFSVKGGSPVRLGQPKTQGYCAIYVHCQTRLVEMFQHIYPDLYYEGNRAVWFDVHEALDEEKLRHLFALAFNYHQKKDNMLL